MAARRERAKLMMVDSAGSLDEGFVLRIRISDNQTFLLDFQKDLIMLRCITDAGDIQFQRLLKIRFHINGKGRHIRGSIHISHLPCLELKQKCS